MNVSDPDVEHHLAAPTVRSSPSGSSMALAPSGSQIWSVAPPCFAPRGLRRSVDGGNYTVPEVKGPLTSEVSLTKNLTRRAFEAMFLSFNPPAGGADRCDGARRSSVSTGSARRKRSTAAPRATARSPTDKPAVAAVWPSEAISAVRSWDRALLKYGEPTPFPNPCLGDVDTSQGASYVLFDNLYDTNVSSASTLCCGC